MGRNARAWSETGLYHVVARGNNRQKVFRETTDYVYYLRLLAVSASTHQTQLHHYCLMPNHVHLLLRARNPQELSGTLHHLQRRYWFYMRRTYRISGHLWQGRYHSFSIESESYLLEAGRYIERNPLQAGMVTALETYPWSSYPSYAYGKTGEIPLAPSPVYNTFGTSPETRQEAYRHYVLTNRPYDLAVSKTLSKVAVRC